jgi:hypothetical protein
VYTQSIDPESYRRQYPLYKTIRIRGENLNRIKTRASRYGQSVDEIITEILKRLEYYERLGYELPSENGESF